MKKNQKGITLVALIITIIVMLILVAVTINVALNGGLFTRAKNASTQTQKEAEKEELISSVFDGYDDNGNFSISAMKNKLPDGIKWCRETDEVYSDTPDNIEPSSIGNWVITPNNNRFYIDNYGAVLTEKPEEREDPNNPFIGKTFMMPGFEIEVIKDIKSDHTLKFLNMDELEYLDGTYTYDPSTNEAYVYCNGEELDGCPYHYFKIGSTSGIYGTDDYFSLFITDSGRSLSLLNGYTATYNGKTATFRDDNIATTVSDQYDDYEIYYIIDDGKNESGEYVMLYGLSMYTITKVNGVYTQMVPRSNYEPTIDLIPPQD